MHSEEPCLESFSKGDLSYRGQRRINEVNFRHGKVWTTPSRAVKYLGILEDDNHLLMSHEARTYWRFSTTHPLALQFYQLEWSPGILFCSYVEVLFSIYRSIRDLLANNCGFSNCRRNLYVSHQWKTQTSALKTQIF